LQVVENFKRLQAETEPVLKIFEDPEVTRQIQQSRDSKQLLEFLVTNFSFKPEMIDTCYNFAKVPSCLFFISVGGTGTVGTGIFGLSGTGTVPNKIESQKMGGQVSRQQCCFINIKKARFFKN
jgi:hypothetical protein